MQVALAEAFVSVGGFHALVIDNNNRAKLALRQRVEARSEDVAEVLRSRYSFTAEVLVDATRYGVITSLSRRR